MVTAEYFVHRATLCGFTLYSGVPCSHLKPLINFITAKEHPRYIPAANEGDAVAIAAGAELGGTRGVAMMQNSGLGNAINPLTSLAHTFRIPLLLIITLRGDPEGPGDEPQHLLMGEISTKILELLQIPWRWFPDTESEVKERLAEADDYMAREGRPFALMMRAGSVAPVAQPASLERHPLPTPLTTARGKGVAASRADFLRAIQRSISMDGVLLATTGYSGRELCALGDHANQLYMVGSMGCVSSLALGLALVRPACRVVVIDGDGALLMRMGALATLGYQRPPNLTHIVLDNGCHESTGGQPTVSRSVNLAAIATACGYPRSVQVGSPAEMGEALADRAPGLCFYHAVTTPGTMADLPRPTLSPEAVAQRLRTFLQAS